MDWQTQQKLDYEREKAEKERAEQEAAAQRIALLKQQFAEQQRARQEAAAIRERQAEEQQRVEKQQQAQASQRLNASLLNANAQRQERQRLAREHIKQFKVNAQEPRVWTSRDGKEFRSPLEASFWDAWPVDEIPLVYEHRIGRFRPDFTHLESKSVIEIDGLKWHTGRYSFTRDRAKDRYLHSQGWRVIRFSGDEVKLNLKAALLRL